MTLAIQTRSLPSRFSAYPASVEGIEGYVVSIDGKVAFIDNAQADQVGRYFLFDKEGTTEPIDVQSPLEPQAIIPPNAG
jgi:hypothetical protein